MQIQSTYLKKNFASQKFGGIGLKFFVVRFLFYFVLFDNFFLQTPNWARLGNFDCKWKEGYQIKGKNKVSKKLKFCFKTHLSCLFIFKSLMNTFWAKQKKEIQNTGPPFSL